MTASPLPSVPPLVRALRDVREILERARRTRDVREIEMAIERINSVLDHSFNLAALGPGNHTARP